MIGQLSRRTQCSSWTLNPRSACLWNYDLLTFCHPCPSSARGDMRTFFPYRWELQVQDDKIDVNNTINSLQRPAVLYRRCDLRLSSSEAPLRKYELKQFRVKQNKAIRHISCSYALAIVIEGNLSARVQSADSARWLGRLGKERMPLGTSILSVVNVSKEVC